MRNLLLITTACATLLSGSRASAQVLPPQSERRAAIEHYLNGREWMSAERWDRAAEEFTAAVKLYPLFTDALYGLGQAYMGLERYTSAALAYQQCLEAARRVHGLHEKARFETDRRTLEVADEIRDTIRRRGANSLKGRQLDAYVSRLLSTRASLGPSYEPPAPVLLALGSAHFRAGNTGRAEYYWKEAVRVDDSLGEAWNNLAVIYHATRRRGPAREALANAERNGYRVNPRLKDDIRAMH
jgi:tetratricopeptide (TPR) repeat protein